MLTYIKGFDTVLAELNKQLDDISKRAMGGLIDAVAMLERDMDTTPPVVPIDTGNLRGSFFYNPRFNPQGNPYVTFGYGAAYAWYVHEMVGANFARPNAGAKFMEAALKRNSDKILKIIQDAAHVDYH